MSAIRSSRKPYMRPKKQLKKVEKKEEQSETHERSDDDASSGSGTDMKDISFTQSTSVNTATQRPPAFLSNECIWESSTLLDQLTKITNGNYAGNPNLLWG